MVDLAADSVLLAREELLGMHLGRGLLEDNLLLWLQDVSVDDLSLVLDPALWQLQPLWV